MTINATKLLLAGFLTLFASKAAAATYTMSYAGQILPADGPGVDGTTDLAVTFYRNAKGGDPLRETLYFTNVALSDGFFQLNLELESSDWQALIPDASTECWIEVTNPTTKQSSGRHRFGILPMALKVPVDDRVLSFDSTGRLTFAPTAAVDLRGHALTGLGAPTAAADAATKSYVDSQLAGLGAASSGANSDITTLSVVTSISGLQTMTFDGTGPRSVQMTRPLGAAAGGDLTVSAGGAASGQTDRAGGGLILSSGTATGNGGSKIELKTAGGGSSGIGDATPQTRMVVDGAGNVGIGSASPTRRLDVNGIIKSSTGGIEFPDGTVMTSAAAASVGSSSTTDLTYSADTDANGSGQMVFSTAGNERLRIGNAGNVGVGTNAPGQKLTVDGSFGILEGGGTPSFHTIFQGGDQTADVTYTLPVAAPASNGQVLSGTTAGALSWITPPSAPVSSVNGQTGAVSLTTTDVTEGTRPYYSDTRARGALTPAAPLTWNSTTGALGVDVGSGAAQVSAGNHGHADATTGASGFLSGADKTTLNGLSANAVVDGDFGTNGLMVRTAAGTYNTVAMSAADKMVYTTAADTYAATTITSLGRSLVDDSTTGAMQTTMGLGTMATQAAGSVAITGGTLTDVTLTTPTFANDAISGDKVDGGKISNFASTGITDVATATIVTITSSGNFGVGAAAPGQKLTVDGTFGILEGGATPSFHTIFQGGDQAADVTYTLPVAAPASNGQVLSGTTAGALSWITPPSAPVSSVNGQTGAVSLTTTDVAEGTSLYYTDTRARGALAPAAPLTWNSGTGALGVNVGSGSAQVAAGNHAHADATTGASGFMSGGDKTTLDGLSTNAVIDADFAANGMLVRTAAGTYNTVAMNAADKMVYTTAADTYAATTITSLGRSLVGDSTTGAMQTTLGLGTMATQGAGSVAITGGTITGVTLTTPTFANDAISGDKIHGGMISNFTSTGISDGASSTAMTITSVGNVGIGSASPATALDVAGQIKISGGSPAANKVLLSDATGIGSWSSVAYPTSGTVATDSNTLTLTNKTLTTPVISSASGGSAVGSQMSLVGTSNASPVNAHIILNGAGQGNVGVGTTAPGQKLTVDGTFGILEGGGTPSFHTIFQGGDQTADVTYTLPVAAPASDGQVLSGTTAGALSWITPPSAPVSSVNGQTGAVSLSTTNVAEGTGLYYTAARARSSLTPSAPLTWNSGTGALGVDVGSGAAQVAAGNHGHANATTGSSGFMSGGDKTALDGLSTNAVVDMDFGTNGLMIRTAAGAYNTVAMNAADKMVYTTAADTYALATISAQGRALIDDANAGTMRATLGLEIGTDVQAFNDKLDDIAGLTPTDGAVIIGDGLTFVTEAGATARTSLGAAALGANSDITSLSGLTTALTVGQGGTGSNTLASNNVLLGNGTGALQAVAPSTSGNVLTSNGTTWQSTAIPATTWAAPGAIGLTTASTGRFTQLTLSGAALSSGPSIGGTAVSVPTATLTDSTTSASGTVAGNAYHGLAAPTLEATNLSVTTTNAYTSYISGAPIRGANNTATNAVALGIGGGTVGAQTNSYGLVVNAQSGATNNYAASFMGSVGIGTSNPSSIFQVDLGSGTGGGVGSFLSTNMATLNYANIYVGKAATGSQSAMLGYYYAGNPTSYVYLNNAGDLLTTNSLVLKQGGNVGIGTTAPMKKLDVNGSAQFKGSASSQLSGQIDPTASVAVVGASTQFLSELSVGDRILVSGETRTVVAITNNLSLTVDQPFSNNPIDIAPDRLPAALAVAVGGLTDFVVQDNGLIGMGFPAPTARLEIGGDMKAGVTGTVSVGGGSTAVTGAGTSFLTDFAPGDAIKIGAEVHSVASVTSPTSLTLATNHISGSGGSAAAYRDSNLLRINSGAGINKLTVDRSGNLSTVNHVLRAPTTDYHDSNCVNGSLFTNPAGDSVYACLKGQKTLVTSQKPLLIFATSGTYTGNLGASPNAGNYTGLAAADAICRYHATNSGQTVISDIASSFRAFLATSTVPAFNHIKINQPLLILDATNSLAAATVVAAGAYQVYGGYVAKSAPLKTETGGTAGTTGGSGAFTWTGFNTFFGVSNGTASTCNDWTSDSVGATAGFGDQTTTGSWTLAGSATCDTARRLYCISQ